MGLVLKLLLAGAVELAQTSRLENEATLEAELRGQLKPPLTPHARLRGATHEDAAAVLVADQRNHHTGS